MRNHVRTSWRRLTKHIPALPNRVKIPRISSQNAEIGVYMYNTVEVEHKLPTEPKLSSSLTCCHVSAIEPVADPCQNLLAVATFELNVDVLFLLKSVSLFISSFA